MTKLPPDTGAALDPRRAWPLTLGWRLARTAPGACASPTALPECAREWHGAEVPGTVAGVLHRDLAEPGRYDADDWWYRTRFPRPAEGERHYLRLEGLATLAEVWLNGERILASHNMFLAHRIDVTHLLRDENDLAIAFRSLDADLAQRRPRPRWKTRLVEKQALRWVRTTLLGRIPAWTPAIDPVGPWGPIVLESTRAIDVSDVRVTASLRGRTGHVFFQANVAALAGTAIEAARLRIAGEVRDLAIQGSTVRGEATLRDAAPWWPHTHGEPRLHACQLEIVAGGETFVVDCGPVGFREIAVDTEGAVQVRVNGVPVFCRGVVWTTADILRLRATPEALRASLTQLRDAGANMLRVGGTMAYERDDFYALCDELGLMVWQDFMFANMDYPADDASFPVDVEAEARQQVARLAAHPCLAVWCGGSEVAQQAAMNGLPPEAWCGDLFERVLPSIVRQRHPGAAYFPSSPWGGALPMHVGTGIAHYYGVGAYRRPLADVKAARVRFAAECLGFSNIPDGAPEVPPHHPRWKAGVPRDNGAGYDFEDVRDHYLRELFGRDPVELRACDLERYYAASRAVSGEVMARTYSEWRAPASGCGGALVWFHRDLRPGAGWGIVAADGTPKSPYWYLKRAWAPVAIRITDEGLDGLALHVINERDSPLLARVEIALLHDGRLTSARGASEVQVAARSTLTLAGDALLGYFTDSTNAYRFGPARHDVAVARLRDAANGAVLSEDHYFPVGHDLPRARGARIEASAAWQDDGTVRVRLVTDTFLQAVAVECAGFVPSDNYFHLAPDCERELVITPVTPDAAPAAMVGGPIHREQRFEAFLAPLNGTSVITVRAERPAR